MNYQQVIATAKPVINNLPGGWEPVSTPKIGFSEVGLSHHDSKCQILNNLIAKDDCLKLIDWMLTAPKLEAVTVQGKDPEINDDVGSMRATIWTPELAVQLWEKMSPFITNELFDEESSTDWWQGDKTRNQWRPIGLSPMMRFMRYENGGEHWAHYDAAFIYPNDNYRTLKSVVIYLTTSDIGGSTRFVKDDQVNMPVWDRDHDDWVRPTNDDEVLMKSPSIQGKVLIFNHRECHDVEVLGDVNKSRVIIRTDILYEAIAK